MRRTYRTLNDCEMQHNAEVELFTKPSDLVFSKFREYGTMRQVYKWLLDERIEIPIVSNGKGERGIGWKFPSTNTILRILDNPIYAGAYVYGRTKTVVEFKNGRKRLRKGVRKEWNDPLKLVHFRIH